LERRGKKESSDWIVVAHKEGKGKRPRSGEKWEGKKREEAEESSALSLRREEGN